MNEKHLINETAGAIDIDDTGARVPASGTYIIPPQDYGVWVESADGGDIATEVNAGNISVSNGTNKLPASLGLEHLKHTVLEGEGSPSMVTGITCDSGVAVGDWVRLDAAGVAFAAIATSFIGSRVIGLCESKLDSTTCNIRISGVGGEIFVGLDETKDYFLSPSTAGGQVTTPPSGNDEVCLPVGRPLTDKRMIISIGIGIEIDTD